MAVSYGFLALLILFAAVPFVLTLKSSQATDSPWFWAYLFGMFALVALAMVGPKFAARQAQIEREFQGRQRASQNLAGAEPDVALSTPEDTVVTLWPLYGALSAATVIAWIVYWRTRGRSDVAALQRPAP